MTSLCPGKDVGQVLEKIFSRKIQENVEKCTILDKKIGLNAILCENYLKQFSATSYANGCGRLLCASNCEDLTMKPREACTNEYDLSDPNMWIGLRMLSDNTTVLTNVLEDSVADDRNVQVSECVRLENAKCFVDSTAFNLLAEEARLLAEINFLDSYPNVNLDNRDEMLIKKAVENLNGECDYLERMCLKFVKDLAHSGTLETCRLKSDRRKARQTSYLDALDRQLTEVKLNCSKLEIFHDIMALEDSALEEMTTCVDKIYTALQKYLDITTDVNKRFQTNKVIAVEEDFLSTPDFDTMEMELRKLLVNLFRGSAGDSEVPDDELDKKLISLLDEKLSTLDAKSTASLLAMKEFSHVIREVYEVLCKALHRLDCHEESEKNEKAMSSSVYWNELSSFSGVLPRRLIERLFVVREELDAVAAVLQKLEISFDLNSED